MPSSLKILATLLVFSYGLTLLAATDAQLKPTRALFFDGTRNREIPVVIYLPSSGKNATKLAVINSGNGMEPTAYGFIARQLADDGYLVVSVQHQLPTDAPLASTGDLYALRRPTWERGVANLLCVLSNVKREFPQAAPSQTILIGHSNGGDICALFATLHPTEAAVVITLDHRRMPLPRTRQPRILSLRADEFPPNPGVLPSPEEAEPLGISIVQLKNTKHIDLSDYGCDVLKGRVLSLISGFLGEPRPASH